jgi:hypothetical protein
MRTRTPALFRLLILCALLVTGSLASANLISKDHLRTRRLTDRTSTPATAEDLFRGGHAARPAMALQSPRNNDHAPGFLDKVIVTETSAASNSSHALPLLLVTLVGVFALRRGFAAPISAPNI